MKGYKLAPLLYLGSATILLVGIGSAALVYRAAAPRPTGTSISAQGEDLLDQLDPEYSKHYLQELERYGGQANVLAYEFQQWFIGLWHGQSLAYVIACSATLISLAVFYVADHLVSKGPD